MPLPDVRRVTIIGEPKRQIEGLPFLPAKKRQLSKSKVDVARVLLPKMDACSVENVNELRELIRNPAFNRCCRSLVIEQIDQQFTGRMALLRSRTIPKH